MTSRRPGLSARLKLTLSYVAFLAVAGGLLLAVVWVFLLRYVPASAVAGDEAFMPGRRDLVRAFMPPAIWALVFLLVLGLIGGWWLAGRMLAPLTKLTQVARAAGGGELGVRAALPGSNDEFRELADTFDQMLDQLEAHVAEQQRFAANASHELRTPLATTRAMLEVAAKDPEHDGEALIARLTAVNDRAIKLTEALLLLSRSAQRTFVPEPVDLSLLAEEAVETLLPHAERSGVNLTVDGGTAVAAGSPALLLQMVLNLVLNSIVHNRSEGGEVWLTTAASAGGAGSPAWVELAVSNTGAELEAAQVATLTEPFLRGADRTRSDHDGVGLGLAIVHSIVRVHEGSLQLAPLAGGGLRVAVRLPAA